MYIWFLTTKRLVSRTSGIVNSLLTAFSIQVSGYIFEFGTYGFDSGTGRRELPLRNYIESGEG